MATLRICVVFDVKFNVIRKFVAFVMADVDQRMNLLFYCQFVFQLTKIQLEMPQCISNLDTYSIFYALLI